MNLASKRGAGGLVGAAMLAFISGIPASVYLAGSGSRNM
jgi:hypothetical protein